MLNGMVSPVNMVSCLILAHLSLMKQAIAVDDEALKIAQQDARHRFLYIAGAPGSGKSKVIVEMAVHAASVGCRTCVYTVIGCYVM